MMQLAGGDPARLKEMEDRFAAFSPLGRIGDPEEAAQVAVWLCSEAASFVTGSCMTVDGGLTATVPRPVESDQKTK